MILANASLDVALHDTFPIIIMKNVKFIAPRKLRNKQLNAFTVGLIDGHGSLQVNHWRKKILQFRLVVKLSDKPLNKEILDIISSKYGGIVRQLQNKNKNYVQ